MNEAVMVKEGRRKRRRFG